MPQSSRYRAGPGRPRTHDKPTRELIVKIDAHLYLVVSLVSQVTGTPKWQLVERGLKMQLRKMKDAWPAEYFEVPALRDLPEDDET